MPAWIGLALLSVSWLLGLHYYHAADWRAWALAIAAGTAGLATRRFRPPDWRVSALALLMVLPAIWLMPWPYRAAAGLVAAGLLLAILARLCTPLVVPPSGGPVEVCRLKPGLRAHRWLSALAGTCLLAGCILLAQALATCLYEVVTSRSHDLPAAAQGIAALLRGLGVDANAHDGTIAVFSMRKIHLFGATWELLLDPPTWCFLVGGVVLLWWQNRAGPQRELDGPGGPSYSRRVGLAARFLLVVALWLPLRAALLIAVYLDRVLRLEYDAPMDSMKLFWNPWVLLAMLAGPVLLAWASARRRTPPAVGQGADLPEMPQIGNRPQAFMTRYALGAVLALLAVGLVGLGIFWEPAGARKQGRVLVEECYPNPELVWERTDRPYDTTWYGERAGYNYYCIFDYCNRYYHVARQTTPLCDAALENCDVLVLKIPTRPYSAEEIDAVVRFVARGGGLLLIGEHTDVFGSGTYLNAVAKRFGFAYRFDCLFGIDSVYEEHFDRPLAPHPMIQYMPAMDFAISCSIDPGTSHGRAVICNTGLKNLTADYHADNFYPQPLDSAEMRYGAFIQLWAVQQGRGRVAAFTDSTVFSNFCAFEPGKAELMLGMLEWLNHEASRSDPQPWLLISGLLLLPLALLAARDWRAGWIMLVAAGLLGWSSAVVGSWALNRLAVPPPPRERPLVELSIDRTLCDGPLSSAGFITLDEQQPGFGIFERWILRLGYFTSRRSGPQVFSGDAIVFCYPHLPVPHGFCEKLVEYVRGGGKVLVVDSPENKESVANELLAPFGLALDASSPLSGPLEGPAKWPSVPIAGALPVKGGEPFAWLAKRPVAARAAFGDGSVTVVGFGSRFTDVNMGVTGDVVPDDELKQVYGIEFGLLRGIIENNLPDAPAETKRP
jgi:hypothetical protein